MASIALKTSITYDGKQILVHLPPPIEYNENAASTTSPRKKNTQYSPTKHSHNRTNNTTTGNNMGREALSGIPSVNHITNTSPRRAGKVQQQLLLQPANQIQ